MNSPGMLTYVDRSEVRPGKLNELKGAISDLAAFIEERVPRLVAYNAYLSHDGTQMTVIHVHHDAASLKSHMDVAGPEFTKFKPLVNLTGIEVFGDPGSEVLERLQEKASMLGGASVVVHDHEAGFARGS